MAAYTTIDDSEAYFQAYAYTGDGESLRALTFPGDTDMAPDVVWVKQRAVNRNNQWATRALGTSKVLLTDLTDPEDGISGPIKAFGTDGFSINNSANVNTDGATYGSVSWAATGSTSAHTDGTIDSTRDTNTTSKFSIILYTGDGNDDATVGHGLGATPDFILNKVRSSASNWTVFHSKLADGYNLNFDTTDAAYSGDYLFDVTSSLFKLKGHIQVNRASATQVAYAWKAVQGFSKFGSYEGNGNADGPFIYTGFRPACIITKVSSTTGGWYLFDNKRIGYNVENREWYIDVNTAEDDNDRIDIVSNGFKWRNASNPVNGDGETMVYAAWAESPFVNSKGVPCNAR